MAKHLLTNKRLNYRPEDYIKLLNGKIKNADSIEELAEENLKRMDLLL
jgi:hypothetical protein